jgi:copper transport protein
VICRLVLVAAFALVTAQAAAAHAIPETFSPRAGEILLHGPHAVRVRFDSPVRAGPENAAQRNDGADILAGTPYVTGSRTLVIPLRKHLRRAAYTVRWSVVSDDGHEEEGLLAFAVGRGGPTPVPELLTVHGFETWQRIVMRVLFFAGVLGAAGAVVFTLLVLGPLRLEAPLRRPQSHLLFAFFLAAFCGSDALAHTAGAGGTRFGQAVTVAAIAAVTGAVSAALTPLSAVLRYLAWMAGAVLLVCPTVAGHALDPSQPTIVAPVADLIHLSAAAVWVGGLASLCLLLRRMPAEARPQAAARFAAVAVPAVIVVAFAGAARALTELNSVSQLWSTGYGRALLAKSALFAGAAVPAWLNRKPLRAGDTRAVRLLVAELVVLAGVAVAIATLTDSRPGVASGPNVSAHAYSGSERSASSSPPGSR